MLEKLIIWVEKWADHRHAKKALSVVAFIESSFFPVPPFALVIAMLSLEKKPSWIKLSIIGIVSSVLGGVFGYFIGKFFYGYIGAPLIAFYGIGEEVNYLGQLFKDHVFLTIVLASLSPIPYKVFTISAGLFSVDIWRFILASIIGRSIRFFTVSFFADLYGIKAKKFILEKQKVVTNIFVIILIITFIYFLIIHF